MTLKDWIEHKDLLAFAERHKVTICIDRECEQLSVAEAEAFWQEMSNTIRIARDWDEPNAPTPEPAKEVSGE